MIPQPDKDAFLDFLRIGKSPPEAAALVSEAYTASMFRRLLSEKSRDYDPFFAAEYLRARAEGREKAPARVDAGKPRTTTLSGHVLERFEVDRIGQVGLRTDEEELFNAHNVGGNNVISREIWDDGLRYDERPWGNKKWPIGYTEDSFFSPAVEKYGYTWTRVKQPCIVSLSREDPDDPYYQETWKLRGITPPAKETQ